ncbi:MAG: hypothetical protein J1E38_06250 [Paramuribaculum sp.]|nr:hypothetical protein [Paramuribaculum sp.]
MNITTLKTSLLKIFSLSAIAIGSISSVQAQVDLSNPYRSTQLPNWDFENGWENCYPWAAGSKNSSSQGSTPKDWTISNVRPNYGGALAYTTVGSNVSGYHDSSSAVKVTNQSTLGNVIPAYFSLGTTWSTTKASIFSQTNKDGGTFGGIEFSERPDALSFVYQSSGNTQPTVVAYSWYGNYSQADVPSEVASNPSKVTMINRERNILGIETSEGGAIDSIDCKRISIINERLKNTTNEWETSVLVFKYTPNTELEKPQYFNVIFSDDDYFSSSPTNGNSLTVDDVKLIYYSRLASLSVKGMPVEGFDSDTYTYTIDSYMPRGMLATEVVGTLLGQGRSATIEAAVIDEVNGTITIKVQGIDWDVDGETEHTYTIQYKKRPTAELNSITPENGSKIENPTSGQNQSNSLEAKWVDFNASTWGFEKAESTIVELDESLTNKLTGKLVLKASNPDAAITDPIYYVLQFYPFAAEIESLEVEEVAVTFTDGAANIGAKMPETQEALQEAIKNVVFKQSSGNPTWEITGFDKTTATATVTVSNSDGADINLSKDYTITFYPFTIDLRTVIFTTAKGPESVRIRGEQSKASFLYEDEMSQKPKDDYAEGTDYTLTPYSGTITLESIDWNLDDPNNPIFTITLKNENGEKSYTVTFAGADDLRSSRLSSITVDGTPIENFDSQTFSYNVNGQLLEATEITGEAFDEAPYIADGISIGEVEKDYTTAVATISVSNEEGSDFDGESTHTYTLQFDLPYYSRIESLTISGVKADFNEALEATIDAYQPVSAENLQELIAAGIKLMKGSGEPTWKLDYDPNASATAKITVSNTSADIDGKSSHEYALTFKERPAPVLNTLTVNGTDILKADQFEYEIASLLPSSDKIEATYDTNDKILEVTGPTIDKEKAIVTYTVTNGIKSNTYTLTFQKATNSRLASVEVGGQTVTITDGKFDYDLSNIAMPKEGELTYTLVSSPMEATVKTVYDPANYKVTVTVTGTTPDEKDGKLEHIYTFQFQKPTNSRLASISVNGTAVANFSSDIYDYDLTDIEMPEEGNVSYTLVSSPTAAKATVTYDKENNKVTITVTGSTPDETDGKLEHIYTLTFKAPEQENPGDNKDPNDPDNPDDPSKDPNNPDNPDDPTIPDGATLTNYDGILTIEMMGEDITGGGQAAKVEIEEYGDGTATFRLPNFQLDLGNGPESLGDIVVENVTVTEENGIRTYNGEVKGFELADGEIVADVTLTGTVNEELFAHMIIGVLWEGIEINVEFNGEGTVQNPPKEPDNPDDPQLPDDDWNDYDGRMTIDMNGYDITEGGYATTMKMAENEDGTYNFLIPDFSVALDSDNQDVEFGDILVENVTATEVEGIVRFKSNPIDMTFAKGEVTAEIIVNGTLDQKGEIRLFVDVIWDAEDGRRIPFMVKFTNGSDNFREYRISHYRGILTTQSEGEIPVAHNVMLVITPQSPGKVLMEIEGIYFPTFSRAGTGSNIIQMTGVSVGSHTGSILSYDGAASGVAIQPGVTVDMTLHGHTLSDGTILLNTNMDWAEGGQRLAGSFEGYGSYSDVDDPSVDSPNEDNGPYEYFDLKGMRVNPENLRPGIYIRRSPTKTEKILITQ